MSSLGYCSLDEAFSSGKKKIKKSKTKDKNLIDKILGRGEEVDQTILDIDRGELPVRNCTNMDELNAIPFSYNENDKFVKIRQEESLIKQKARDQEPNEWQKEQNNESKKIFEEIQLQIFNLTKEIKELKNKPKEKENNKPTNIEGYVNYNIDTNKIKGRNITFDNDQFNELLLYIFTGIFLLIVIDYIYKLGKKSF
jgi:hypothetical protein